MAEAYLSLIVKFKDKIKASFDLMLSPLTGTHIHEIQSKIGFSKNILSMVVESKAIDGSSENNSNTNPPPKPSRESQMNSKKSKENK